MAMPKFNLSVLGQAVSFRAEADHRRIEDAKNLLEERFDKLGFHGRQVSKEKLLIFLALGLADDLLLSNQRLDEFEDRLEHLLVRIDEVSVKE